MGTNEDPEARERRLTALRQACEEGAPAPRAAINELGRELDKARESIHALELQAGKLEAALAGVTQRIDLLPNPTIRLEAIEQRLADRESCAGSHAEALHRLSLRIDKLRDEGAPKFDALLGRVARLEEQMPTTVPSTTRLADIERRLADLTEEIGEERQEVPNLRADHDRLRGRFERVVSDVVNAERRIDRLCNLVDVLTVTAVREQAFNALAERVDHLESLSSVAKEPAAKEPVEQATGAAKFGEVYERMVKLEKENTDLRKALGELIAVVLNSVSSKLKEGT